MNGALARLLKWTVSRYCYGLLLTWTRPAHYSAYPHLYATRQSSRKCSNVVKC